MTQGFRERSDPIDVGVVSSLLSGKGKWSSDPRDGCFKGHAAHFQRDCNASKNTGKQTSGKGNQNKSWSMSELSSSGRGKVKRIKENPKDCPKEPRVRTKAPKAHAKAKHRKWDKS